MRCKCGRPSPLISLVGHQAKIVITIAPYLVPLPEPVDKEEGADREAI